MASHRIAFTVHGSGHRANQILGQYRRECIDRKRPTALRAEPDGEYLQMVDADSPEAAVGVVEDRLRALADDWEEYITIHAP